MTTVAMQLLWKDWTTRPVLLLVAERKRRSQMLRLNVVKRKKDALLLQLNKMEENDRVQTLKETRVQLLMRTSPHSFNKAPSKTGNPTLAEALQNQLRSREPSPPATSRPPHNLASSETRKLSFAEFHQKQLRAFKYQQDMLRSLSSLAPPNTSHPSCLISIASSSTPASQSAFSAYARPPVNPTASDIDNAAASVSPAVANSPASSTVPAPLSAAIPGPESTEKRHEHQSSAITAAHAESLGSPGITTASTDDGAVVQIPLAAVISKTRKLAVAEVHQEQLRTFKYQEDMLRFQSSSAPPTTSRPSGLDSTLSETHKKALEKINRIDEFNSRLLSWASTLSPNSTAPVSPTDASDNPAVPTAFRPFSFCFVATHESTEKRHEHQTDAIAEGHADTAGSPSVQVSADDGAVVQIPVAPDGSPNSAAPSQIAEKPVLLSPEELQNMHLGPIMTQPIKFIKFNAPFEEEEKINYFKITNASTNRIGLKIDLSCPDRIQTDVNVCCLDVNGSIKIRIVTKRFDLDKNAQDCIAITWMNVQNEGDIDEEFFEGDGLRNKKTLFVDYNI